MSVGHHLPKLNTGRDNKIKNKKGSKKNKTDNAKMIPKTSSGKAEKKLAFSDAETDSDAEIYENFSDSDSDDSVIRMELEQFLKENNFDKFKEMKDSPSEKQNETDKSESRKRKIENSDTIKRKGKFKKINTEDNFNESNKQVESLPKKNKMKKKVNDISNNIDTKSAKKSIGTENKTNKSNSQVESLPKKLKSKKKEPNNSNSIDKKKRVKKPNTRNDSDKSNCPLESLPKKVKGEKKIGVKNKKVLNVESSSNKFNISELKSILNSNGDSISELPVSHSTKRNKMKETLHVCQKAEPPSKNALKKNKNKDKSLKGNKNEVSSVEEKSELSERDSFKEKLKKKLQAASFRLINEDMYTSSGSDAYSMFQEDPEAFKIYHEGYSSQVSRWPVNPVTVIATWLRKKPKKWVVADFGCGEATLARSIPQQTHSLDLVACRPGVIECDMSNTPLKAASVDVVVFCLSLMGTNLADFILEANRVLVEKGVLKIAEVESRFDADVTPFLNAMWKLGFRCIHKNQNENYFWLFDFLKVKVVAASETKTPQIQLRPCIYKKR